MGEIHLVLAMDKKQGIGKNGKLPWYIPNDMKYFKQITLYKIVVMGRKTFESIGKPLPKRYNIILTRDKNYVPHTEMGDKRNLSVMNDARKLTQAARESFVDDLYIIGGSEIFREFVNNAQHLHLTYIDEDFKCDTFVNCINMQNWILKESVKGVRNKENPYTYYFNRYIKREI